MSEPLTHKEWEEYYESLDKQLRELQEAKIAEQIRAAQEEAWQRAHDNYCERCWSSRPCPNPYLKES